MNTIGNTPEETFLAFAFSPCSVLDNAIRLAKTNTREIAGDQTYLSHPPHITLFVSAFQALEQIVERCKELVSIWTPPKLEILGWNYFPGDVLTGNQTLVCEIANKCQISLREYQRELIGKISSERSVTASSNRYRPHFTTLSKPRQIAVESFGFPFVGGDWIPHLTVASIDPIKWDDVWDVLQSQQPRGSFVCQKLTIFQLQNDNPRVYREFRIVG